jgi:hypothetical protein
MLRGRGDQRRAQRPLRGVRRFSHQPDVDVVLITQPSHEREGKNRLARIGFDRVIGYLDSLEKAMYDHQGGVQIASRLSAKGFGQARRRRRRWMGGGGMMMIVGSHFACHLVTH